MPDCRAYDEAIMITAGYYLRSSKDGSSFWPVGDVMTLKDYWVMSIEGQKRPVRVEVDGVLKVGRPVTPPSSWPKTWDGLKLEGRHEYTGCDEVPAIIPDPLVRVMQNIEKVEAACHTSLNETCTRALFAVADQNKNKKLSVSEMKTAAAMLASISLLIESNSVPRDQLDKAVYQALRETDRLAARFNGREPRYEDFNGFLKNANSPALSHALMSTSLLIPGFKE